MNMRGLLGAFQTQPDQFQSLLGEYYDPKTARMKWLGGTLQGLGMGLASGQPGAWATGLTQGGGQAVDDYRKQAMLGYQAGQQAEDKAYGREQDAKTWDWKKEQSAAEQNRWDKSFNLQQAEFGYRQKNDELDRQAAAASAVGENWRIPSADEKASLGLPPNAPVVITKNGPKLLTDGGTNVTVNNGGASDKDIFAETKAITDSARSAATGLTAINSAGQSLPGAITGAAANERLALQKVATLFGADPSAVQDTETFRAAIAPQVAAMLKATVGSTQISNADRDFAEKAAGGAITLDKGSIARLINIMRAANSDVIRRQNEILDTVYPEGKGFDRERALFGVPNVPKAYPSPIGPQAPIGGRETLPRIRRYNPQTGKIE